MLVTHVCFVTTNRGSMSLCLSSPHPCLERIATLEKQICMLNNIQEPGYIRRFYTYYQEVFKVTKLYRIRNRISMLLHLRVDLTGLRRALSQGM